MMIDRPLSELTQEELWQLFPIVLAEHNPDYEIWYKAEVWQLVGLLGDTIVRINHIGSTAVPGLLAKPTIDILVELREDTDIVALSDLLLNHGWLLMHDNGRDPLSIVFAKGYTTHGFAERVFHLHVRDLADWDELYFRDYLIDHPEAAHEYGVVKEDLRQRFEHDRDAYTQGKTSFIEQATLRARADYGRRYAIHDEWASSQRVRPSR